MESKERLLEELIKSKNLYKGEICPMYFDANDLNILIQSLQSNEWVRGEKYDKSKFTPPFRVGRKQKRAILDSKGLEVIVFPTSKVQARMYCNYLNLTPPNRDKK